MKISGGISVENDVVYSWRDAGRRLKFFMFPAFTALPAFWVIFHLFHWTAWGLWLLFCLLGWFMARRELWPDEFWRAIRVFLAGKRRLRSVF
ncbi:hypothetical protein HF670_05030 [Acidithiobacillus thiooxidans]|uniref:hypothetical protein n=1 Tax=Acidithiobacillus TaxID=119977 RepID=UPI001111B382|nr:MULTISPECIES: hypothetical protein [Acidithiobacillus]MBU2838933.1 hypothetical protein [Acidithiobacillus thiooxidans]